jgi:tRNA A37 N6-isopentenylltransferase MiaA
LILIGLAAMWAAGHMTILAIAVDRIQAYDISKTTALNFFRALLNGIISPMNIIGTISIVIGGTIIYFTP